MAKGDKQDVAKAKAAVAANKPGAGRRATNQVKNTAKLSKDPNAPRGGRAAGGYYGEAYGPITNKEKRRIQLKGSLTPKRSGAVAKEASKAKVAAKQGAKNKIKAQGAKINSTPMSGYNRRGKK